MRIASSWMFALVSLVGCQRVAESEIYQEEAEAAAAAPAPARCRPGTAAEVRGVAWSDVQDALDQAQPYDVVNICPGVWQGNFVLPPHAGPLELRGVTGDPDDVVLDGGGSGILLDDALGGTWRLRALTLQNADTLAQLSTVGTDRVEILDCSFSGAVSDRGLAIAGQSLIVKHSTFRDLTHTPFTAHLLFKGGQILLEDVLFEDNGPDTVAEIGFSSWATPAVPDLVTLRRVSFRNNVTEGGGSLRMEPSWSARVLIEDSEFIGNDNLFVPPVSIDAHLRSHADAFVMGFDRTIFADNQGGDGTALWVNSSQRLGVGPDKVHFGIRDSAFLRNRSNGSESHPDNVAALFHTTNSVVHLRNVNFGVGADTNEGHDVLGCDLDLGAHVDADLWANAYGCP